MKRQSIRIISILALLFMVLAAIPPVPVKALGLVQLMQPPANFQFSPITLNGKTQTVEGPSGSFDIVINQLLSLTLIEDWVVTVQAARFTETGEMGKLLPYNSLKLNMPVSWDSRVTIADGPWYIDAQTSKTIVSGRSILGVATQYKISFGPKAFTLTLDPGLKVLAPNQHSTQYTTTITWTLTNPVL